jgi:cytochrome d ubiquinol oxidase subunit I
LLTSTGRCMDLDPVFLSRVQFGFVVSFHIIFPAFTIGLAAWLATLEGMHLATGRAIYRRVFEFWMKVFAVSFGMGVVTGIVMAFQFGTNWGVLAEKMGSIQGPLLGYEGFTAFLLEATFFGVMLLGRERVSPRVYLFACCMVALGTMFSSFWIMANNSWMQVPVGYAMQGGKIVPTDWWAIVSGPVMRVRWPHMLLGAYLTTGMCIIATGAWYLLRGVHRTEARVMLNWGLGLVALLIPLQLFVGHLTGDYVHRHQPAKFAAIEARWQAEQPASEVLIGIPDEARQRNRFALSVPKLGSFIASGTWDSREPGLESFAPEDRPPVLIPFFAFRIMVGMGLVMLAISWIGNLLRWTGRLEASRWFLWGAFLSFPSGFVAVLAGWFTAEVGRQPWVAYGLLRTRDAVTPSLSGSMVLFSLCAYVVVYAVISFGAWYIYKLLRRGPGDDAGAPQGATAKRPLAFADTPRTAAGHAASGRIE